MYQFCKTFQVGPETYYESTCEDVDILLLCEQYNKEEELRRMRAKK